MVVLFIRSVTQSNDAWTRDTVVGRLLDPDPRGFNLNAGMMHINDKQLADAADKSIPRPDENERTIVPRLYECFDPDAIEFTSGYVSAQNGDAVSSAVAEGGGATGLRQFHKSLRNPEKLEGHSICVWHSYASTYVLPEPNSGCCDFLTFERFAHAVRVLFAPETGATGGGPLCDYTTVCCWGISLGATADALPPAPQLDTNGR